MKEILKQFLYLMVLTVICLQIVGPITTVQTASAAEVTPESINLGKYLTAEGQEDQPKRIGAYLVRFTNFLSLTIGSFAFLALVIGGIFMITAGGREEQITRGKDIIKYSIMGLIFAMIAYFLVAFIQTILFENAP